MAAPSPAFGATWMDVCGVARDRADAPHGLPADRRHFPVRVLCLGNELLADDRFGAVIAAHLGDQGRSEIDVVLTANTGFDLLDYTLGAERLIVVDTVMTGASQPGTVFTWRESDLRSVPGGSPHYVGLFEALALARLLGLAAPTEVMLVCVEGADCTSVGGAMDPAVEAAVPGVLDVIDRLVGSLCEDTRPRR